MEYSPLLLLTFPVSAVAKKNLHRKITSGCFDF